MSAIDIKRLVEMLAARAPALAQHLFPAGRREGREWRIGSLAGEAGSSMAIHLEGLRAGVWADFSDANAKGDALDLVAQTLFRGDKKHAVAWSRAWLGLDGKDPAALAVTRRAVEQREKKTADDSKRRAKSAFALWLNAWERLKGTPVDRYLKGRAIDLDLLGRQPRALRYVPALEYWQPRDDGGEPDSLGRFPAMVAAIVDAQGRTIAVHRTYLQALGDGRVVKADVPNAKKTLGDYRGGCIRLWRGVDEDGRPGRPLNEALPGSAVVVTEGIEDGLSIAIAEPAYRVLVGISLSNMANLKLPAAIATVILAKQNDKPGSAAAKAFDQVVAHFAEDGRTVLIAAPPASVKDANDLLAAPAFAEASAGKPIAAEGAA